MAFNDALSDMLARIKNSQLRNYKKIEMPSSKFKAKIAEDRQDYEHHEYLMSKFKKMLEQNESAKVSGMRLFASGPNAIR